MSATLENQLDLPLSIISSGAALRPEANEVKNHKYCYSTKYRVHPIDSVVVGEVTLEGSVFEYWEKTKAEKIALEAAGTTKVINKLSVVPTRKKEDMEIAEDIVAAFDRNANVGAEWVDVKVEDGKVTLSGNLPDKRAYRAAYNVAASTSGVIDIINNLQSSRL
jgi:hypothetical protein